jgi:hypothetical protein
MSAYVPFDSLHWVGNKPKNMDRKPVLAASPATAITTISVN